MTSSGVAPVEHSILTQHYTRLAKNYDDFLSYSGDFVRRLSKRMIERLRLTVGDAFVDIGGGTGMYTRDILEQVPLRHPALVVDPFEEMLAVARRHPRIRCLKADALSFAEQPGTYDKILMKEAVHHVDDKDRLFRHLHARLTPGGILLLVHVPPDIDYPLFRKALNRAARWHPDAQDLTERLARAGFSVESDRLEHHHEIPKAKYFEMVRSRYMSLLSSFDDEEIESGIKEMEEKYAHQSVLRFADRFDYLTATKA